MHTKLQKNSANSVKCVKNDNYVIYSSSCWYKPKIQSKPKEGFNIASNPTDYHFMENNNRLFYFFVKTAYFHIDSIYTVKIKDFSAIYTTYCK